MGKFYLIIVIILTSTSIFAKDFWERVNVPNDSRVMDVCSDKDGNLYTASIGVYKSEDNADSWIGKNDIEFQGHKFNLFEINAWMSSIFETRNGELLACFGDGFVLKSTDKGDNWEPMVDLPQNIKNIIETKEGIFYAYNGINLYTAGEISNSWTRVENIGDEDLGTFQNIRIFQSESGDIYVPSYHPTPGIFIKFKDSLNFNFYSDGLDSTLLTSITVMNDIVFAGSDNKKGLFRSFDNGKTWEPVTNFPKNISITSLYSTNDLIFAGTDSSGLFSSTNEGLSWTVDAFIPKNEIFAIKELNNKLYVCSEGLYVSEDYGTNWTLKNNGLSYPGVFIYDNNNLDNHFAMTANNFFKSEDNCKTWESMDLQFEFRYLYYFLIDNVSNLYVASPNKNWFFYSSDNGITWLDVKELLKNQGITVEGILSLAMNSKGTIFLVFDSGKSVWKSDDNGQSWEFVTEDQLTTRLFIGNNDEILLYNPVFDSRVSIDDGLTWKTINIKPEINEYELSYDIIVDNNTILFAGSQTGFHISTDGGETWDNRNNGINPNLDNPDNPNIEITKIQYIDGIIYIATESGVYYSDNLGELWNELNSGSVLAAAKGIKLKKDNHLYISTLSGVYRSTDEIVSVDDNPVIIGNSEFKVYPNPAKNYLNITATGDLYNNLEISLFDLSGNNLGMLYNSSGDKNSNIEIPLNKIATGSYYMRIKNGNESKIVIIKVIK